MVVDLGTGDGRAVLARAAAEPRSLVIGTDADAASMAEASRRAARPVRKGGSPNAIFVVAAAEAPPAELAGRAALVTIILPWGSLLRGVLGTDPAVLDGIVELIAPGGQVEIVLAPSDRDLLGWPDDASLEASVGEAWGGRGMSLCAVERMDVPAVAALPSTWARRLGRAGWRLVLTRDGERR